MKCHICEGWTDFDCQTCNEPVFEDCCVPMTYMNQIDYALCTSCETSHECERWEEAEIEEALNTKRDNRNKAARDRYWRPENVKKRKDAIIERKRLAAEQARDSLAKAFSIVGEMMGESKR